ncbi:unnamed protein product [Symbiodinium natans]|uniref:Uncharacterized protein n=1 Tax=Symbiodinium natans TaxID=878477 RepID=A0A812U724_9DINO|nr:unnamed protein product [Symbiodinium natans]
MGATQCGFCCLAREKAPDGQQPQAVTLGLPDLLTKRRDSKASPDDKEEKGKEVCGTGSEGSEPQPASQQETKKATAAEEREAFLQALMRDRAEADRIEIEARKEAKRAETLRRLEATNRAIRAQFDQIAQAADSKEASVQFMAGVEEIPMDRPLAPCVPASSTSSMTGVVKKPILKGAGERKHVAPCHGQARHGQARGEETPSSSNDSVYPDYDDGEDLVCFED